MMSEQTVYGAAEMKPRTKVRTHHLQKWKAEGHKWAMLTAYDYSTARVFDDVGIPVLLVGDSAANVVYGYDTTVPVTIDELIPLVQADGRWHFDSQAGAQELVNRRIGRNEIAAIRTCLAYVDAQKAYHAFTGENGEAQYARRLVSSPGKYDGLYWPSTEGQPESPLAPLMAQAIEEGYPGERVSGKPLPYHGYYFRILTGQGTSTPEGPRNYVSNGRMTNGFALIAWPALYGASGIMSFIVNRDGTVFQKDLGPRAAFIAWKMMLFNPDLSWAKVEVID
jgi:hypothetical protein